MEKASEGAQVQAPVSKDEDKKNQKKFKESKAYSRKIKRHKDAVLAIHSVSGIEGKLLISGSADHTCRIWSLAEQKMTQKIEVERPKENELFKFKDHQMEVINYAPEHILNTQNALNRNRDNKYVCCFCFQDKMIFTGYEDGLICSWDHQSNFVAPLIGHTNRINCIVSNKDSIVTASNDCTVRQWKIETQVKSMKQADGSQKQEEYKSAVCVGVFKFADPVSVVKMSAKYNMLFTASWDKMVRCVDLDQSKIVKSFIASKEAIKCMEVHESFIFVAGCDPIIRSFDLEHAETRMYQGHKGWIYTIQVLGERMFSGGDDRSIIIWDIMSGRMLEQLNGHENGVTSIGFAWGDLYTGSYDHHIIQWDLKEINERIDEKDEMHQADIESRRYEVYWRLMDAKGKKKKKGKGGAKKGGKGKKK